MGTKWDKNGKKWESRNEMETKGKKVRLRTRKWDTNGNQVGTKREQEPLSGTRMGKKWEQSRNKNGKNGSKEGTRTAKWDKNGYKVGQEWEKVGIKKRDGN